MVGNDLATRVDAPRGSVAREVRVAVLGLGNVGAALASLAAQGAERDCRFTITSALVRDVHRRRAIGAAMVPVTGDPGDPLASRPDVLVEVMGGLEPARTLVLAALAAGVPVVTANKSLLAMHGDELFEAAARSAVPLLYEASVLAGVPFLGTFERRPLARHLTGLRGIVNGTSNFILSRMARERVTFADALADAQRAGYAEPDPSKDINGDDAIEKLCVLLRHFGDFSIAPAGIQAEGIGKVEREDLEHAAQFGGAIKPVVCADWQDDRLSAWGGPAFVDGGHALSRVEGVENAVALTTRASGDLFFSGPGAGPRVTAATVLDDVVEAFDGVRRRSTRRAWRHVGASEPDTGWFVRLASKDLNETAAPALLAALGVRVRRTSAIDRRSAGRKQWLLTQPCTRPHLTAALDLVAAKTGAAPWWIRALD